MLSFVLVWSFVLRSAVSCSHVSALLCSNNTHLWPLGNDWTVWTRDM